jgi:hypothetical protein
MPPTLGGMGRHIPRTTADELTTAQDALAKAQRALHDLQSHLDRITTNPGDAAALVPAARRNAGIALSELDQASAAVRAAGRLDGQLRSVS